MSELNGERPWTDEQTGWGSGVEQRLAPLRTAAFAGLVVCVLLLAVGAAWLQHTMTTTLDAPWGAVVCFVLAVGALGWGGLSAIAFWVCRAVLGQTTSRT